MSKTNDYSDYSSDDHDDEELSVSYINEALSYSRLGLNHAKPNIEIQLKIAGSTKGRNIISQENDNTVCGTFCVILSCCTHSFTKQLFLSNCREYSFGLDLI